MRWILNLLKLMPKESPEMNELRAIMVRLEGK